MNDLSLMRLRGVSPPNFRDLEGAHIGDLLVLKRLGSYCGAARWRVQCERCGAEHNRPAYELVKLRRELRSGKRSSVACAACNRLARKVAT